MNRPIDQALAEARPAKTTIRNKWVVEVQKYAGTSNRPLYLTLPGAEGRDIQLLIDAGLIRVTETGAIEEDDQPKVIAVEANSEAVLSLQRRFPGLRIRESRLEDMISGASPYAWPTGSGKAEFCARVINIDSDQSLRANVQGQQVTFPLLSIIKKISQIHHEPGNGAPESWSLCVTVNGTINWPEAATHFFFRFLGNNCAHHELFRAEVTALVGEELVASMQNSPDQLRFEDLALETSRRLLCIFLPKMIVSMINDHHWHVEECLSLQYGGEANHAPMSTLILALHPCEGTPGQRYEANLNSIVRGLGRIDVDGAIHLDAAE